MRKPLLPNPGMVCHSLATCWAAEVLAAAGYKRYGLNHGELNGKTGIIYREWAPAAKVPALNRAWMRSKLYIIFGSYIYSVTAHVPWASGPCEGAWRVDPYHTGRCFVCYKWRSLDLRRNAIGSHAWQTCQAA